MGIAVASGAPPATGIITGIIGGLIVGALAGSPLQVSGPAAGLTVIVYEIIQEHGMEKLAVVIMLAGIIQMKWAWLQLGQWFRAVSPAVVHGMLGGIGVLIFAGQFQIMIDDAPQGSGLANLLTLSSAIWKGLAEDESTPLNHHLAGRIGMLTIVGIVLWNLYAPRMLKAIPSVLVGVSLATAATVFLDLDIAQMKVRDDLLSVVQWPSLHSLQYLFDPAIIGEALALALIASVETLLSATAVDQLHAGPRTRYNKELFARSGQCALRIPWRFTHDRRHRAQRRQCGSRRAFSRRGPPARRLAAALCVFPSDHLALDPHGRSWRRARLTGYKLMNVGVVKELKRYGKSEVLIYGTTLCTIVMTNLLTGVLIGIGLAMAKLLYTTQNLETYFEHDPINGKLTLNLMGT